jgi:hypothetical protein
MFTQYTILEKGNDVLALERGTFESGNKIEELEKAGYMDLDLEVSANSPEQAIQKYKAGDLKVIKTESDIADSKTTFKSKYGSARTTATLLEVFGWLSAIAGIALGVFIFNTSGIVGISTAISAGVSGLFLIGMAQLIVAIVDIADNSTQLLQIEKNKHS